MISPPVLRKGSKVTILSSARKIAPAELRAPIALLKNWGLKVELGKNIYSADNQFAGTVQQRIQDLQNALDDPSCEAIIFARGGYGSVQLIDHLNFNSFLKNPKWLVGYSDVCVFHSHLQQLLSCESIHATMPVNFPKSGKDNQSTIALKEVLFGEAPKYHFLKRNKLNRNGSTKAEVVGGNLSILYSLTGTASSLNTNNKILFLEDLDEYLYHIDRMMMNLKRAGMLENLSGLLIGGMTSMNDNLIPFGKTAEEIIADNVKEYSFPVAFDFPAGHLDENLPLILGRKAALEVSENGVLLEFNDTGKQL